MVIAKKGIRLLSTVRSFHIRTMRQEHWKIKGVIGLEGRDASFLNDCGCLSCGCSLISRSSKGSYFVDRKSRVAAAAGCRCGRRRSLFKAPPASCPRQIPSGLYSEQDHTSVASLHNGHEAADGRSCALGGHVRASIKRYDNLCAFHSLLTFLFICLCAIY